MSFYLGVDAGGTRSTALLADEGGAIRGRAEGGPANYQAIGREAAGRSIADIVGRALTAAEVEPASVAWAGFGIAGADRPRDFAAIDALLAALPAASRRTLVNDTELVLRAGTEAGVGIALVSGTGTNALGRSKDGRVARVGGFCSELGDFGSAGDLGREALGLAMRGHDGRGEPTQLYARLCEALGVDPLEDVVDRWMEGDGRASDFGRLAPLVFECAAQGDRVAIGLLERAGRERALEARLLIERLFSGEQAVTVVLGGSVLSRGADPTLVRTVARELSAVRPKVTVLRLEAPPAFGAVLLAHDAGGSKAGAAAFAAGLARAAGRELAKAVG